MMEHDNAELSTTVQRTFSNFNVVFDESRHVAGALTIYLSPRPSAPWSC